MPLPRPWLPALALALALPPGALAGKLDLDAVVQRSQAIVLAHPATPASRKETVDITPPGKAPDAEKYPAFVRHLSRWVVDESLTKGGPQKGEVLELDEAEWTTALEAHRSFHLEHVEKLPDWSNYVSTTVRQDEAPGEVRRIVFLQKQAKGWAFTARGSLEPASALSRVKQAMAKGDATPRPAPGR